MKTPRLFKKKCASILFSVMAGSVFPAVTQAGVSEDYQQFCSVCHGQTGDGQSRVTSGLVPAPQNFTTPGLKSALSRQEMIDIVADGKSGTAMTAWRPRLGMERIELLVDYIREIFKQTISEETRTVQEHPASRLYGETCAICHGDDGGGTEWGEKSLKTAPRNFLSGQSAQVLSPERIRFSIANGRPGTAMVGFSGRLSEDQIDSLADFVWSVLMHQVRKGGVEGALSASARDVDQSAPMPYSLAGDPGAGAIDYATHCVACHGLDGAGDGPRARFIKPPPRAFTSAQSMAVFNRPGLFYGTKLGVAGKPMPAWGSVLSDQEIANIAEFLFTEFIRPDDPGAG